MEELDKKIEWETSIEMVRELQAQKHLEQKKLSGMMLPTEDENEESINGDYMKEEITRLLAQREIAMKKQEQWEREKSKERLLKRQQDMEAVRVLDDHLLKVAG
eukprot:c3978_g1_i1.p1 GENE.c3978_g1_i1~~c3978_g1_i1.p1  ORF type:complete len:104 (-),score=42.69 c3978_g1_i1:33-344(-)